MKVRDAIKLIEKDGWFVVRARGRQTKMYRFLAVIERMGNNFSAYCPDLPGCVATGATREEVEKNIVEAIEFHMQGMREEKLAIPQGTASAEVFAIPS